MRILVIGDLIVDKYVHGHFSRANPEGHGQVFVAERSSYRLGGAAAVAMLAASLGATVDLITVVGRDQPARIAKRLCEKADFTAALIHSSRRTTVKQRTVENGRLLDHRIDWETVRPIGPSEERVIASYCRSATYDAILVSDYAKGCVTKNVAAAAAETGVPLLVDPGRDVSWSRYPMKAIIKANLNEARWAASQPDAPPGVLLGMLAKDRSVIITAGEAGIFYCMTDKCLPDKRGHVPGIQTNVVDVCGAGDTVFAAIGVAIAGGVAIDEACRVANQAAAVQVSRLGVAKITPKMFLFSRAMEESNAR